MQRNWIGRSEGAQFEMAVIGSDHRIEVFTTRPDTAFGMTFVVLAPEHPLVNEIVTPEREAEVARSWSASASSPSSSASRRDLRGKARYFHGGVRGQPVQR